MMFCGAAAGEASCAGAETTSIDATELEKVQKRLGIPRVSIGTLSEAGSVFDPTPVQQIIRELAAQALPLHHGREAEALQGLTAVDGSVLKALPRMAWALWQDEDHRGLKLHLHFDVFTGTPRQATVTAAACSEPAELQANLEAHRLYVIDRGYQDYSLFREILDAKSSFIGRVKNNIAYVVQEERELTPEAREAGMIRDVVLSRLGTSHHKDELQRPVRLVVVTATGEDGKPYELWLITDRLEMPADLIALGYRYRWTIEIFHAQYDEKDNLYRRKWQSYIGPPRVAEVGTLVPATPATPAFKHRSKPMRHVTDDFVPPRAQRSFLSVCL
jgi:hypothetical protein